MPNAAFPGSMFNTKFLSVCVGRQAPNRFHIPCLTIPTPAPTPTPTPTPTPILMLTPTPTLMLMPKLLHWRQGAADSAVQGPTGSGR